MENDKKKHQYDDLEQIDLSFEQDLASAYKPVDELFDTIMDDDGYEDFKFSQA